MARVPDAVQRLFGGAPQSRDPQKRSMDPGSATHHAAKASGARHSDAKASEFAVFKTDGTFYKGSR
jgi:hypothetical protein